MYIKNVGFQKGEALEKLIREAWAISECFSGRLFGTGNCRVGYSDELNNAFSGRNEVVDRLCGYPLLVIDDFGMERGTEYALEQIYNIIDSRYRSRKPLIVTTNLTLTELKKPQDTAHARIYDRLLELCTPIACTGPSMRKDIGQAKLNLLKTLLA